MMLELVPRFILPAAYALLPPAMNSPKATAMLVAIGLQESRFRHRQQIGGPARGFWQFEREGGVKGVMRHSDTAEHARKAMRALGYDPDMSTVLAHETIADNDVLAAVFARLLLWTVPGVLPHQGQSSAGWRQYIDGWRPGRPHPATWSGFFADAWAVVEKETT